MSFISFGKCKKKNIFIISSIILSYIIYEMEYYCSFYYDVKGIDTPQLFSLYLSFSFFGSICFGGIIYNIIENKFKEPKKSNKIKKEKSNKKQISFNLLYDEKYNEISVNVKYYIISAFLELISIFSFHSLAFDFLDIESKMLFSGFGIIIIKIFGKYIFKNRLYKHQIISMIILVLLLIIAIISREQYLKGVIHDKLTINEEIQEYIKKNFEKKRGQQIMLFFLLLIVIGIISNSFSICYDNWLMTIKLCSPYKLLFFKGLFGFILSLSIQIFLFYTVGERKKTQDEIFNIKTLIKRASFPFSSFKSFRNILIIILFLILAGLYNFSIIYTNNKFRPEFVGFVIIVSSGLSNITNEIIKIFVSESHHKILYLVPLFYFIIILICSLIICEIIILNFCGCNENTASNIDKRANLESIISFQKYIEDELKEDEKVSFDDLSSISSENSRKINK